MQHSNAILSALKQNIAMVVVGKEDVVELLLTALLAAAMLLPLGTIALAEDETSVPDAEAVYLYVPGNAPAQTDISAMIPALHGVLLAMDNQGSASFSGDRDALSWEMMYNLLSMYGQMDSRAWFEEDVLVLPGEAVLDYSAAILPAPLSPADLTEELNDRMSYDADFDEYRLYCGSDDLSQVVVDECVENPSGVSLSGRLVYLAEEETLLSFTAELTLQDNMFGYALTELTVM